MHGRTSSVVATFVVAVLSWAASAATYYVSPAGNDAGPGTRPDKPWKTLKHSFAALRAGDTLVVGKGSYRQEEFRIPGAPLKGEDPSKRS